MSLVILFEVKQTVKNDRGLQNKSVGVKTHLTSVVVVTGITILMVMNILPIVMARFLVMVIGMQKVSLVLYLIFEHVQIFHLLFYYFFVLSLHLQKRFFLLMRRL